MVDENKDLKDTRDQQIKQLEEKTQEIEDLRYENADHQMQFKTKLDEVTQDLSAQVESMNEKLKTYKAKIHELKQQAGIQQIEDSE